MMRSPIPLPSLLSFTLVACAASHPTSTSDDVDLGLGSSSGRTAASSTTSVESVAREGANDIAIVEVASEGCTPTQAKGDVVVGADGAALLGAPGVFANINGRYVVEGERGTGFITVGDVEAPRSIAEGDDHLLAGATDIGIVSSGDHVQYTRLSTAGTVLEGPVVISDARAYAAAGARSGDAAFVAWATFDGVRTTSVKNGTVAAPVDLEAGTPKDSFAAALAPTTNGALVIWSDRRVSDDHYRVYSAWMTPTGMSGLPHVLFSGETARRVVAISPTKTGFAVLLSWGQPARPMLVTLDARGQVIGHASVFGGAREPLGVAVQGDTVGLLARRDDGALVFRGSGEWVCLAGTDASFPGGALIADGDGFSVAHGDDDGTVTHVRIAVDGHQIRD